MTHAIPLSANFTKARHIGFAGKVTCQTVDSKKITGKVIELIMIEPVFYEY